MSNLEICNADLITILNSGFENPTLAEGNSTGAIPDWFRLGPSVVMDPSPTQFPGGNANEGENVLLMQSGGLVRQTLPGRTLEYGTYTFQFDVGDPLDIPFGNPGFSFLIGATIIVPLTSSSKPVPVNGGFTTWEFTYEVLDEGIFSGFIGDPILIRFLNGSAAIDNVRGTFAAAVPEPSIGGLAAMAGASALCLRRKKKTGRLGKKVP